MCSAVEYIDWEIRELDCRMRAERETSVEAELQESLFNLGIAIASWSLQKKQVSLKHQSKDC